MTLSAVLAGAGCEATEKCTFDGSMMTVGTKLRKMWLQSVRTFVLLKATSKSSMASRRSRSPSFCRYSKEAHFKSQPLLDLSLTFQVGPYMEHVLNPN